MTAPASTPTWDRLNEINRLSVVTRLLTSAVHDSSNALQVISATAELMEDSADDPAKVRARAQTLASTAARVSERLRELVGLAFDPVGPPRRLDLGATARRAIALRQFSLSRARITVAVGPPDEAFHIMCDQNDLIRMVVNLVLNAERALAKRPDARIELRLSVDAARVVLEVSDNGPGVPAGLEPHLFEPFAGAGAPGIGLAVVRGLASRYDGTLTLAANSAAGATFQLTLPAAS